MPRERRVVIVESLLTPTQFRETVCEALLEVLNVPSVLFIPSHLAATFPFNTEYALVVDVGYVETLAVPLKHEFASAFAHSLVIPPVLQIAESVTMLSCWELSSVGSRRLEDRVRELLKVHGRVDSGDGVRELKEDDWKIIEDSNVVEDICVRFVFCCPFERGQAIQANGAEHGLPPVKSVKVPLGAEFLIIPGFVREAACEVFFERSSEDPSIGQMIHTLVERCPLDLRKLMFESILLTGGPTLIPGFLGRLKEEIADIAKTSASKMKQCESIRFYRFPNQTTELYLGWLGGSMFGALQDAVRLRSVSREAWLEERILPDWTDYVQHGIPCGKPELDR
ncbi:Actin [Teladorsagia circumcincta]|uniref:Actin n=1 Tax=Teladorsagia circumcincta TaxID=45464 RepID=A0A2G9U0V3_TELCI|nr:Actin [Teladorsagia circumcincta]